MNSRASRSFAIPSSVQVGVRVDGRSLQLAVSTVIPQFVDGVELSNDRGRTLYVQLAFVERQGTRDVFGATVLLEELLKEQLAPEGLHFRPYVNVFPAPKWVGDEPATEIDLRAVQGEPPDGEERTPGFFS
jgi:hypothetical protein